MKQMRLDFPIFSGDDPVDWLNKAKQFFQLYQIPDDRRITIAIMHLVGNAANLWQLYLQDNPLSWNGLVDLLMKYFGTNNKMDHQAVLARMNQTGSVIAYRDQFTKLSCRAPDFSPELRLTCFIGGLREDYTP